MSPTKKPPPPCGPKGLGGSTEAKRQAAVILEVLSGVRGTAAASQALKVSVNRYYQLETRALQGLIAALEPRPRGRVARPEYELERLRREVRRLERELGRAQALVRAAQRSIGLPSEPKSKLGSAHKPGGRKQRRPIVRAMRAASVLHAGAIEDPTPRNEERVVAQRSD